MDGPKRRGLLGGVGDLGPKNVVVGLSSLSAEIQSQSLKRQLLYFLPPPPTHSLSVDTNNQSNSKVRSGNLFTLFTSNSPVRLALKSLLGSNNNLSTSKISENTDLGRKPLYDKSVISNSNWLPAFSRLKIRSLEYAKILLMLSTGDKNVLQGIFLAAFSNLVDGNPENGELLTTDSAFVITLVETLLGIEKDDKDEGENDNGNNNGINSKNNNNGQNRANFKCLSSSYLTNKRNNATGKSHLLSQILRYNIPQVCNSLCYVLFCNASEHYYYYCHCYY